MIMMSKLILASRSHARRIMLENAGLSFDCIPSDVDEGKIKAELLAKKSHPKEIATALAIEKAKDISQKNRDTLVIGADQILEFEGTILSKASTPEEARDKLSKMNGKTHTLYSSVSVVQNGNILFSHGEGASLAMKNLSKEDLEDYLAAAGECLTRSVGAYELEGFGAWLFSSVKGDYFTILGMPLLPLLDFLMRKQGVSPWQTIK